jgi:PAS domain S-box-containing protein
VTLDLASFCSALVQQMSDAVIYADSEGHICFWSPGAERIFGFTSAEATGQSLDIIIPPSLRKRHSAGYAQTMRTGQTRYGAGDVLAVPALREDGTRISIEFTIVPFHDAAGSILGIAAVLRDVTKRFDEMRNLRQQVRSLQVRLGEAQEPDVGLTETGRTQRTLGQPAPHGPNVCSGKGLT